MNTEEKEEIFIEYINANKGIVTTFGKLELNKIAARWPAKAVA